MTDSVPYIPGSVVSDSSWLLLNSRSGIRYILVDTHLLQMIETHGPWHKNVHSRYVDPDGQDRTWSARRNPLDGSGGSVLLHRWLLKAQDIDTGENLFPDLLADHINRRRWDNRLTNLRLVPHSESKDNQSTRQGKNPLDWGIYEKTTRGTNHYWVISLKRNRAYYHRKSYRKDTHSLDEVRTIRNQAYEEEWGRPASRP